MGGPIRGDESLEKGVPERLSPSRDGLRATLDIRNMCTCSGNGTQERAVQDLLCLVDL